MDRALAILLIEDVADDAELTLRFLRRSGLRVESHRVEDAEGFAAALRSRAWDVILCDYALPRFSAVEALAMMQEQAIDLPFLIVSGTIGEEAAVAVMRGGAHDYFIKGALDMRLVTAIEREIRDARIRAEQRRLRELLLVSDRMASMGMLSASLAHEINNPLAAAVVNVELVHADLSRLDGDASASLDDSRAALGEALEALDRIRAIVRDLRVFSAPGEEVLGAVDVSAVIDSTLRMARNETRHRTRVVCQLDDVPPVRATESRLGQVFLNLLVNAAQAMPDVGHEGANLVTIRAYVAAPGKVTIEFSDNGPGIPEEVRRRIFQPFFTTKSPRGGTGLGLSICQRIVTEFGGSLSVDSEPGQGSTFRIILPATRPRVDAPEVDPPPSISAPRRARILIVDDEELVTRVVSRALARDHDAEVATDPRKALHAIESGEVYDIILCDLMMPTMSGMELHERLKSIAPGQADAMIFMTGGTFTARAREFLATLGRPNLDKPFGTHILREFINARLAG